MHREVPRQGLELVRVRDEVRLAVHLHQHADPAAVMKVMPDRALVGGPVGTLRRLRCSAAPQEVDRRLEITPRLLKSPLAVHHPGTGAVPEGLHVLGTHAHLWTLHLTTYPKVHS